MGFPGKRKIACIFKIVDGDHPVDKKLPGQGNTFVGHKTFLFVNGSVPVS